MPYISDVGGKLVSVFLCGVGVWSVHCSFVLHRTSSHQVQVALRMCQCLPVGWGCDECMHCAYVVPYISDVGGKFVSVFPCGVGLGSMHCSFALHRTSSHQVQVALRMCQCLPVGWGCDECTAAPMWCRTYQM